MRGPFRAPAADLELKSATYEPGGEAALELEGVDLGKVRDGRASLFSGDAMVTQVWFDSDGWPGSTLKPPVFIGLVPGAYSIEVYVREAYNSPNYLRGAVRFELAGGAKISVKVRMEGWAPVEIQQDPTLRLLRDGLHPRSASRSFLHSALASWMSPLSWW